MRDIQSPCDVFDTPETKALVCVLAIGFGAALVDCHDRLRKRERLHLKVQRSPVASQDVVIARSMGIARTEQIGRSARANVSYGSQAVGKRQMHDAVAAEDEVNLGKLIGDEIELAKLDTFAAVFRLALSDELGDDVAAGVIDGVAVYPLHPVEIAARSIEHRADTELAKHISKPLDQDHRLVVVGAATRNGSMALPCVLLEDFREDGLRVALLTEQRSSDSPHQGIGAYDTGNLSKCSFFLRMG